MGSGSRETLDRLWEALDRGDPEAALELAQLLEERPRAPQETLASAAAHLAAGLVSEAEERLDALPEPARGARHRALWAWLRAELLYRTGRPAEALEALGSLATEEKKEGAGERAPDRDAPGRLGTGLTRHEELADRTWLSALCHDHLTRRAQADRLFRRAAHLAPTRWAEPVPIRAAEARRTVRRAAERLPAPLRAAFEEVPVVIDDLPALALVRRSRGEISPDTLGLYSGTHLQERSVFDPVELPATIQIFRRNLERAAVDREELEREIEITLLHELGHHLGYDEEQLGDLGLS